MTKCLECKKEIEDHTEGALIQCIDDRGSLEGFEPDSDLRRALTLGYNLKLIKGYGTPHQNKLIFNVRYTDGTTSESDTPAMDIYRKVLTFVPPKKSKKEEKKKDEESFVPADDLTGDLPETSPPPKGMFSKFTNQDKSEELK